ncbi:hypothetical protein HD553DRAFT_327265 [Filobasidium floriforme]|uniref:uncharacterized protein n=1 Tax=Filobasidium floriforme TaxID=5210 RepID=UPI001E8E9F34|nr:uncharacterized protein HD553DRAFT_327265 [Filobasidium floriforme]KAH8077668.1 hypothetical protein HD553DRAFT_327265 [Filobasidium floriforme]
MGLQILFELFELEMTTNQWKVTNLMPNRSLSWSGGFDKRPKHRIGIQTSGSMCQVEVWQSARASQHSKAAKKGSVTWVQIKRGNYSNLMAENGCLSHWQAKNGYPNCVLAGIVQTHLLECPVPSLPSCFLFANLGITVICMGTEWPGGASCLEDMRTGIQVVCVWVSNTVGNQRTSAETVFSNISQGHPAIWQSTNQVYKVSVSESWATKQGVLAMHAACLAIPQGVTASRGSKEWICGLHANRARGSQRFEGLRVGMQIEFVVDRIGSQTGFAVKQGFTAIWRSREWVYKLYCGSSASDLCSSQKNMVLTANPVIKCFQFGNLIGTSMQVFSCANPILKKVVAELETSTHQ